MTRYYPFWRQSLGLFGGYLLLALLSIALSRQQAGIASLWYANAAGIACLVTASRNVWPGLLLSCALANLAANLLAGDPWRLALAFLPGNLLEILIAAGLIRQLGLAKDFLASSERMLGLLLFGILIPGLVAATGGAWVLDSHGLVAFELAWSHWYCSSVIGAISLLPCLLLCGSSKVEDYRRLPWLVPGLLLMALCNFLVMRFIPDPFIYLAVPLIGTAFLLPPLGLALLIALSSIELAVLLAFGGLPAWVVNGQVDSLRFFIPLSLVLLSPFLVAAASAHRRGLLERAQQAHDQLEAVFESAPGALLVVAGSGQIVSANGYAHLVFGANPGALVGKPLAQFLPGGLESMQAGGSRLITACRIDDGLFPVEAQLQRLNQAEPPLWVVALRDLSIEQQHQQALRASERFLRALTDNLPAAVAYVNPDLRLRFTNQTYRHWFATERSYLNRPVTDLAAERDEPRALPALQQALAGVEDSFDYACGERHIQVYYLPDWNDGQVQGVLVIRHDISDLKRTQAKLSETSQFLDAVVEHIPNMLFMKHADDLSFVLLNRAGEQLLGYPRSELMGRNDYDFFPVEQAEFLQSRDRAILASSGVDVQEEQILTRYQGLRMIRTYKTALRDEQGMARYLLGISEDITEAQAIQNQQLATMALQSAILDNAAFAIIATHADGQISVFNRAAERMLGYSAQEIIGHGSPLWFHDPLELQHRARQFSEELAQPIAADFEVLVCKTQRGLDNTHEWTYRRKNGGQLPVLLSVSALTSPEGQVTGYLGLAIDMTDRKLVEQEREYSRKQAELASRSKSEFVANMSHEIRTPMNAVLGITRLLENTPLNPEQQKLRGMLQTAGESLLQLLNDILDFSKIEAGRLELEPIAFSLDRRLNSLSTIMAMNAGTKPLELVIDDRSGLQGRLLKGDELRLQQVLVNLIGNAIKFTEKGLVRLSISRVQPQSERVWLRFDIQDTGIGISSSQQQRLFTAFTQADASMTRRFGGTGLGLTISKRLVELMQGQIQVRSQLGQGSQFSIVLPFELMPTRLPARTRLQGQKLLLIEPWPATQSALTTMLETTGAQTDLARSPEQALSLWQQSLHTGRPYDLLLVNGRLPGGDGRQLIDQLNAGQPEPVRALLMLSSADYERQLALGTPAGVGLLVQPVTASALFELLEQPQPSPSSPLPSSEIAQQPLAAPLPSPDTPLQGRHILLVEDNELNQVVARMMLTRLGAQVSIADNGQQAVEMLTPQNAGYDLVLMDAHMPVMDGFAATRYLRQQLGLKLPVIAMTAGVTPAERGQCSEVGMNDFIGKPVDEAQLLAVLQRYLPADAPVEFDYAELSGFLQLYQLTENQPDQHQILYELLVSLPSRSRQQWQQLLEQWQQQQPVDTARILHSLRGSLGTLGAQRFSSTALALELQIKDGSTGLDREWQQLETEFNELMSLIEHWLRAHPSSQTPL